MADDHIKHVVLLLLENRSFDQMLGCLQASIPDLDGIDPGSAEKRFNVDANGQKYFQEPTQAKQTEPDPDHESFHVVEQIKDDNAGFVRDYQSVYPNTTPAQRQQIMSYYPQGFLPALHQLGSEFTVCDRWFSSLPGPTWANRFFALSGTCSGKVTMPGGIKDPKLETFFQQTQDTIFNRLQEAGRSWWIYYYDIPCSLVLNKLRQPDQLEHYRNIQMFFDKDVKDEQTFPDFVFIEPKYSGIDQNDDHPPHNVIKGEKLIADVYNAIHSNTELWNSTLFIVAFDEHGGFYDHVVPPLAVPPAPPQPTDEYTFDRYGVRVPALLISPWVGKRVEHTVFDHTSVLKYLIDKWGLNGLTNRTAAANSIAVALTDTRRDDTIGFIRVPFSDLVSDRPDLETGQVSPFQESLHALSFFVARDSDVFSGKALELLTTEAGVLDQAKASAGGLLIRVGTWLTAGVEQHTAARVKLINEGIASILSRAKRPDH